MVSIWYEELKIKGFGEGWGSSDTKWVPVNGPTLDTTGGLAQQD